ncbi:MAG: hypothetical protein ABSH13_19385 [Candidatus Acidiferrum sp.]
MPTYTLPSPKPSPPAERNAKSSASPIVGQFPVTQLIGNYLTTDQVLAVGGIQFQSEPLRKRNHLVELRMLRHATVTMSR